MVLEIILMDEFKVEVTILEVIVRVVLLAVMSLCQMSSLHPHLEVTLILIKRDV